MSLRNLVPLRGWGEEVHSPPTVLLRVSTVVAFCAALIGGGAVGAKAEITASVPALRCLGPGFTVLALGPGFRPIFIHSLSGSELGILCKKSKVDLTIGMILPHFGREYFDIKKDCGSIQLVVWTILRHWHWPM